MTTEREPEPPMFAVWTKDGAADRARSYRAATARQAAEQRARADYDYFEARDWPITYFVQDGVTGQIWTVLIGIIAQPSFVALDACEVSMLPATHVL